MVHHSQKEYINILELTLKHGKDGASFDPNDVLGLASNEEQIIFNTSLLSTLFALNFISSIFLNF